MKNSFLISVLLTCLTSLSATSGFAGAEGHGGGAFVCRDSTGKIKEEGFSVEVSDIWEGRMMYRLPIRRSEVDWLSQVTNALDRLQKWQPELYQSVDMTLVNHIQWIPGGAAIAPPQDFRSHFWKKGCQLEGAASFNDQSHTIYIDPELTDAMSRTDFAALIVHEIIYKALREKFGEQNSVRARRITAFLFADAAIPNLRAGLPKDLVHCETAIGPTYSSFFVSGVQNFTLFQFEWLDGQPMMAHSSGLAGGQMETTLLTDFLSGQMKYLNIASKSVRSDRSIDFRVDSVYERFQITILSDDRYPKFTCKPFAP